MKKIVATIPFLLWSIFLFGQAEIKFDTTVCDYGRIVVGNKAEGEFHFTNIGTEPLIFFGAYNSNGGGTTNFPKKILPGERGVITVSQITKGRPGLHQSTITVKTNSLLSPTTCLTVKGEFILPRTDDCEEEDVLIK
ncbi:MAG: DUF1573 domain-containing protein [Prevotellaceae bacterium]|jgi:hypothetical protein|nr:DUF1573 domain-containing protein [Prevotellaceae bacterium]